MISAGGHFLTAEDGYMYER